MPNSSPPHTTIVGHLVAAAPHRRQPRSPAPQIHGKGLQIEPFEDESGHLLSSSTPLGWVLATCSTECRKAGACPRLPGVAVFA
jgi:hypothetical protein